MYALDMEAYMYGYQYPRYEAKKTPIFTKIVKWTPEEAKLLDGGYIRDGNRREKHINTQDVARFPGWNDELVPSRYRYGIYLEMERYGPVYWQPNLPSDLPLQVTMNPERYSHMLSRRNSFSGFKDLRERLRLKRYKKYTCAELGGKERSPDDRVSPKVYDFFLYNGEQDLLEIRLNTLGPVVDKFLLAETNWTFTGKSKPFHFPTLKGKPASQNIGNWGREGHNRNRGLQQALALIDVQDEDFIQISDLDEIWRPTVATTMRKCTNFEKPHLTLRLTFQYFGFEFHHHAGAWANGKVLIWNTAKHTIDKVVAQSIRDDHGGGVQIHDAGWHCSWCFGNMSHVLSKVNSYSHQEHNQPEFLTRENILNGFKYGFDLFGRTWDQFEFHPDIQEIPDYVAHNRERFEYMLRRRNEWGGFYDVKAEIWKNITGQI
ncbi:hypothetical protein BCR33DRAFT_735335 [Rhizoclosmatium globosum]|uniref:Glycosyltransferase family 17 protein n=1 Tax=Rhizoclosmatium globosum TaxID=329046 RepID=A0A1Y2CNC0_9FUNG|nr:hypothetical protein BCR33DRAFT_735335 [Rhizoclosmatium globosum]|eukprot:ORY48436.1 hypothetical protein BCR33DRAFT_735335 [Rhizoclosmatium globosum]